MHPNDTTLNEYADGTLGAADRRGVDQHLAECASCRQVVDDLHDLLRTSRELEPQDPPVRAWARLERAIRMEQEHGLAARTRQSSGERPNAGRHMAWLPWLAAAAALVLATVVGIR